MAEYGSMFVVSALAAILFFGGWNGPIPVSDILGLHYSNHFLLGLLGDFLGVNNLLFKSLVGVTVMMWVRWTLPRLRIDQVITTCLKYCVPLAAVCFVGVIMWQFANLPSPNDIDGWLIQSYRRDHPGEDGPSYGHLLNPPRSEIRERWAQELMDQRQAAFENANEEDTPAEEETASGADFQVRPSSKQIAGAAMDGLGSSSHVDGGLQAKGGQQ